MNIHKEFEAELAQLLHFAGTVAWAARMHSIYLPATSEEFKLQGLRVEGRPFGVDLFHLTNAVCHLTDVGRAIALGDRLSISRACSTALAAFASYASQDSDQKYSATQTFDIWRDTVHLDDARNALQSIQVKNWLRDSRARRLSEG